MEDGARLYVIFRNYVNQYQLNFVWGNNIKIRHIK
jgi:hypothetical protein